MADAYPDPKTGENQYISGTFRLEAQPAYLVNVEGKMVADAGKSAPITISATQSDATATK